MAKYLGRDEILGSQDVQVEDVVVPEWGGVVRVMGMSAAEKDAFEASITSVRRNGTKIIQQTDITNVRAKLVARSIVDENGELIFTLEDIVELGRKSSAAMDRVVEVAQRLNRMSQKDLTELETGLKNAPPAV